MYMIVMLIGKVLQISQIKLLRTAWANGDEVILNASLLTIQINSAQSALFSQLLSHVHKFYSK